MASAEIQLTMRYPWWAQLITRVLLVPLCRLGLMEQQAAYRWACEHTYYRIGARGRWHKVTR